jgi:hypothetical protein
MLGLRLISASLAPRCTWELDAQFIGKVGPAASDQRVVLRRALTY